MNRPTPTSASCGTDTVVLPRRLLSVLAHHGLRGIETMLVVHLFVRWSDEGIDDDNRMAVNTRAAIRALDSVTPTIDAAMIRLVARRLIVIEYYRGRRFLRLNPLRYDVGRLWPEHGDPDAVIVRRDVLERVMAKASRGKDALFLLALVLCAEPGSRYARCSAAQAAPVLGVTERAAQRMAARLVQRGVIGRAAGGFDLGVVLGLAVNATLDAMNGRYAAALADARAHGRRMAANAARRSG
jgi:hypothetical protein